LLLCSLNSPQILTLGHFDYFESDEFKKEAAKQHLFATVKNPDGSYSQQFKINFVKFSQNAKSLTAASAGFESILKALGLFDDETRRCIPTRSTTTLWRSIEAEVQTEAYVGKLKHTDLFGINCDGSERKDKNVLVIRGFFWSEQDHRPYSIVLAVLDMQSKKKAADMLYGLLFTIEEKWGLKSDQLLMCMSDNTNSMSGQWGGVFALLAEHMGIENEFPRLACFLHALHLGYSAARPILWGKLPARNDRSYGHFWNFLWDLWKEFGAANPLWNSMVSVCEKAGLAKIEKTWKPVSTRWLYELYAVRWYFQHKEHIALCCKNFGSTARWKRIKKYLHDPWINAQALALVNLSEVYMRPMQKDIQTDETPRLFPTDESTGELLPRGFRCHKLLQIHYAGLKTLMDLELNAGTGNHAWWYDAAKVMLKDETDPEKQPEVLLTRVKDAGAKLKDLWVKWTADVATFPFVTMSLGGELGSHFAYAATEFFVDHQNKLPFKFTSEQLKLAEKLKEARTSQEESVKYWREVIRNSLRGDVCTREGAQCPRLLCGCTFNKHKRSECQGGQGSLRLLEHMKADSNFTTQFLQFADGAGTKPLRMFPLLYKFACLHIYSMQSDQQQCEGDFNLFDQSTAPQMSMETAGASVVLKGLPALVRVDASKRAAAAKEIKRRPPDYACMSYICRVYGLHGEEKGSNLERITKPRSRACQNKCKDTCQRCVTCEYCTVLYFKKGRAKHMWSKHPKQMAEMAVKEALLEPAPVQVSLAADLGKKIVLNMPSASTLQRKSAPDDEDAGLDEDDGLDDDNEVFCYCQQPDNHEFMLQCEDCEEWYHLDCLSEHSGVVICQREAEDLESFCCPVCTFKEAEEEKDEDEDEEAKEE